MKEDLKILMQIVVMNKEIAPKSVSGVGGVKGWGRNGRVGGEIARCGCTRGSVGRG